MSELTFERVTKYFGTTCALDNFSLTVPNGALVSLLGPSGCGKTTALRVAAGFDSPDSGRLLMSDNEITDLAPQRREMGMVFQNYSLFPHLTVRENVSFGLRVRGESTKSRTIKAREMMDLVQIGELGERFPHQISGGQQQRVALARALAVNPKVLLLDEPLSALDAKIREDVRDAIRQLQKHLGTTTLFVTHDQTEALSISDVICVMNDGQVLQIGTPREIYMNPINAFVAQFIGDSVVIPAPQGDKTVRPESLVLLSINEAQLVTDLKYRGCISRIEFHGSTSSVYVRVPGIETDLRTVLLEPELRRWNIGDEVVVSVRH